MKITHLLYAEVQDDAPQCCGMCPELFAGQPVMCLRFGDKECVRLDRDDKGRIERCRECVLAAERCRAAVECMTVREVPR
jgi:hypothetical protein